MPIISANTYLPRFPFTNGHIQTIFPILFRKRPQLSPKRERIDTEDGDFLDLDWHHSTSGQTTKLAIISHGLEGNSRKKNILAMTRILCNNGWDVLCWNFRGCSGEPNRLLRLYHSGSTDDLDTVLQHARMQKKYTRIALIGFSVGGNQTCKYLGESAGKIASEVKAAVAVSVPCMLADASHHLAKISNRMYMHYFMRDLKEKIRKKAQMFPDQIDLKDLEKMKCFYPFDNKYTGPLHGFRDADEYYSKSSSRQFLPFITIPTLMVQAQDDPFLPESCYPYEEAEQNPHLFLETPRFGGHVGFIDKLHNPIYWIERRTIDFLDLFVN